jgi:glycosyltransferase involved in cell wall biosynthesis
LNQARNTQPGGLGIVVVGQLPPPYGGQAVMMENLLYADLAPHRIRFVRLNFTREMSDIGHASWRKVAVLPIVIAKIVVQRIISGCDVLLYPPAGPGLNPVLRDVVILCCVRWMFRRTIFYFHAGGVMAFADSLNPLLRRLVRWVYRRPDMTIRTSTAAPDDGAGCDSRRDVVVENGVIDLAPTRRNMPRKRRLRILYVGVLKEDKGILVLLESFALLRARGVEADLALVGAPVPRAFQASLQQSINRYGLEDRVLMPGVLLGEAKADAYQSADVLCFPTYFASETSGLVVVEAMSCSLPVVATHWRGLGEIVDDGHDGFLVAIKDPVSLADRLEQLLADPQLRADMGKAGRRKYECRFTLDAFGQRLRQQLDAFAMATAPRTSTISTGSLSPTPTAQ